MAHTDAIPFPMGAPGSTPVLEQLAPDICRVLAGPRGDHVMASLRALLIRFTEAFGADEACVWCPRDGGHAAARVATSNRASELTSRLFEGRWFSRQLSENARVMLPRGAADMPPEADVERECIRASGMQALIACAVSADSANGYLAVFSKRPLMRWVTPAVDQLEALGTLFSRATLWACADDAPLTAESLAPTVQRPLAYEGDGTIVGSSDALRYVLFRVDQVAPTNATVLLLGETGTGKELDRPCHS